MYNRTVTASLPLGHQPAGLEGYKKTQSGMDADFSPESPNAISGVLWNNLTPEY